MRILHVPYTYAPDPIGGTEHYVRALAEQLQVHGCNCTIAAPGPKTSRSWQGGLEVFRFAGSEAHEAAQGVADPIAAAGFQRILAEVRPHIVHLHARTAAVSELLLQAARAAGARTVVTYHTPTLSCMRGTMLHHGRQPCDGVLEASRCTSCVLRSHGLAGPLASALAQLPAPVGRTLQHLGLRRGAWLAPRMRQIVEDHIARTHRFLSQADLVIAPCQWVLDLLLANGLAAERLRLCRQGLTHPLPNEALPQAPLLEGPLRLGFFGRLDPTKGIEVLIKAMQRIPSAPLDLVIHGVGQQGSEGWSDQLQALARSDTRIRFLPPMDAGQVLPAMAKFHLVVAPSLWLETGPLVVLEAFAAGTPVLGSDLGGISEVVRTGGDGQLVAPGDVCAWADALAQLAEDPSPIWRWRVAIKQPRTMVQVASEMAGYYREIHSQCSSQR